MAKPRYTVEMLESVVFQALGTASMCWSETPTGVFESDRAKSIGEDVIAYITEGKVPEWHS